MHVSAVTNAQWSSKLGTGSRGDIFVITNYRVCYTTNPDNLVPQRKYLEFTGCENSRFVKK